VIAIVEELQFLDEKEKDTNLVVPNTRLWGKNFFFGDEF
jgi:hypothetical protein